ncbi:MAG: phosphoenolpyruvate carboxylase [Hyphomicrobiaceae bacterium]
MDQKASQTVGIDEFALRDELRRMRERIPDDPLLNPITNVAFDLSRRLESGEITLDDLKALSGRLMDRACIHRARRLRERIGYVDSATTMKEFSAFVESRMQDGGDDEASYAAFVERFTRIRNGVVLTAHPTFGLSEALTRRMIEIASSDEVPEDGRIGLPHRPDDKIDLGYEHARAQETLRNLRTSYFELLNNFISVAAARYGDRVYAMRPRLATIASWIGYDLDGRTDITWSRSFLLRIEEKRAALIDFRERFLSIRHRISDDEGIQRIARQITGKLDLAIAAVDEQVKSLANALASPSGSALARAANIISRSDSYNLTSTKPLTSLIDEMVATVSTPQMKRQLAALNGLIDATGLGTAHIHVRINATQLNNAFRAYVHEPWTRDLTERQALQRIVAMIDNVKTETVNFQSLELETATAIRQFGLIAQIKKHVDADTPIRFLIAECESPATILIAVFFAKLFGVTDIVDISPLFETPDGLENGPRLMERLLEERSYREYIRGRGRISIQTGFSDAGRFIGQISATLAIERLHFALADMLVKAGVTDVETLIFSTHGESMGRGAHPDDLETRLRYVFSDEARRRFARHGLGVKHETSFQGGDGFMWFANRSLTSRALATIIMDGAQTSEAEDALYDVSSLTLDFMLRLKAYQQSLFAHRGYRAVLGAFGTNLLFKTGSRAVKRQSEGATAADRGDPARMRAIPNNAILQQFGYIANVVAGLGTAVGADRDRFLALAATSPRLRTLLDMIAHGKRLSSLNALSANATVFDAGFWAQRAAWGREPGQEAAFRSLAVYLLTDRRAAEINGFAHHLRLDAIDLHQILETLGIEGGKVPDDHRLELDLLQAIRLAVIMRVFILAAQLPRFAAQNDTSHSQILNLALSLDVPDVVAFMREAFPFRVASAQDATPFDEPATYRPHGIDDYGRLETEILVPMERSYELIREIGTGISHHFGAFG